MIHEKKTLVILAFDRTKTSKKKLKKTKKEILSYFIAQDFSDFFLLKEQKKGLLVCFEGKQKKILPQEDLHKKNYENYLYINCNTSFFCGDFNFFCQQNPKSTKIGLSYKREEYSADKKEIPPGEINELPFKKEKIVFFSKNSINSLKQEKKEPKFIFGKKILLSSSKALQTIQSMRENRRPCLFLDRDGIIIKDKRYLSKINDIEFMDGIFDLIKLANEKNWYVIILTNQSGIGQGLYSEEEYQMCENYIEEKLKEKKLLITKTYFSPYHQTSRDSSILKEAYTRKPFPGMLLKATSEFPIDLEKSYMIGDKKSDEFIETSLTTYFLKGDYPLEESKRTFSNLHEIKRELETV